MRQSYELHPTDEELEKEIADMGWSGEDYAVMQRMSYTCYSFSLQGIVQTIMRKVMEFLFRAASLVVDTIRTFFLIVLSVLGPFAFAVSVFDGFQGTLVQWLARYISVYLWLPISDLLGAMLAKIQTLVLQSEMEKSDTQPCLLPTPAPQTFLPHEGFADSRTFCPCL